MRAANFSLSLSLQSLSDFKLALRQQSEQSEDTLSSTREALELCRAVHKFHFQLLVLLGSYIKLVTILERPMETSPVCVCVWGGGSPYIGETNGNQYMGGGGHHTGETHGNQSSTYSMCVGGGECGRNA